MKNDFLERENSNIIKLFSAIIIMICHFLPEGFPLILKVLFNGTLCTSVFFFYGGFGLRKTYKKYHTFYDFFKHKIVKVWIPYCFFNAIYYFFSVFYNVESFNIFNFIMVLFGLHLSNGILWFVIELFVLDLIFFLIFKIKNENKQYIIISFILIIFI